MKILLIGEYNRAHKFLKEGLIKLNHEAIVVGLNDGFKKVDVDILIKPYLEKGILKKIRVLFFKLFRYDLHSYFTKRQIIKHKNKLSGYDVIQFINESSFLCQAKTEKEIINLLTQWNKKVFLLSCGTDYPSVKYAFDKKLRYSILTPYFEKRLPKSSFSLGLKYLEPEFIELHKHMYNTIEGVISCDLDYTIPLKDNFKHLGLIPHAINTDKIAFTPLKISDKIVIFHGINRNNYYKKGNDIFEKALEIVKGNYNEKIKIITVENLPYHNYIKAFDEAHIFLDQVFAYDQGYNALEAMAKGKVVFTGAEQEWLDYYNLKKDTVAINALPDEKAIAKKIEWLILNPEKLIEISKQGRAFVEKEHYYIKCAKQYLNKWQTNF
ncbi:glycosyltransferase [Ichthyenterobacterium magnum]|uniref:Glycosyltransferase involved in cell wall biosynthesis n=1 Tax=Ichthyenterobacterium magnum TaxID=1230530 RepID=A0A420DV92_9FLAO|nr:glycosyltransferase [Ichthyenterobacterium magnum]RKE98109.1 glycosyltransferase involved in cell wall biosynthesis [Ichthyenterobacterium magnum]